MKFTARRRLEEPQIGLTPLIDIVFLLLIFFMVTTAFVDRAGLAVSLPEAGHAADVPAPERAEVVVDAADRIYIGGKPAAGGDALRMALAALARESESLRIRADGRASHQAVVTVMDTAAALGFRHVDIATRSAEPAR